MCSQSNYVYNEHPAGLGRMAIRETEPMFYDDRMSLQPVDSYLSGESTVQQTVQPTVVKTPTVNQPVLYPAPIIKPAPVITTTSTPVVQPIITTSTSKPQTGGSHPVVNPELETDSNSSGKTDSRISFIKVEGDQLVINGNHRIGKKKAALVGGGLIGVAVLLKLVL
jgi:hypothetical protein